MTSSLALESHGHFIMENIVEVIAESLTWGAEDIHDVPSDVPLTK
jgi:hypothetical protein